MEANLIRFSGFSDSNLPVILGTLEKQENRERREEIRVKEISLCKHFFLEIISSFLISTVSRTKLPENVGKSIGRIRREKFRVSGTIDEQKAKKMVEMVD